MKTADNRLAVLAKMLRAAIQSNVERGDEADVTENMYETVLAVADELEKDLLSPGAAEGSGGEAQIPSDTPDEARLDFLDALIADHAGQIFVIGGDRGIGIQTLGAVDVRAVLDAAMRAATTEAGT